mgnify:FL=1
MILQRSWAMPNSNTFSIYPVKELIESHLGDGLWIDPFVRNSIFKDRMSSTNDLNREIEADYHMDALEFLKIFKNNTIDGILFDPPYSPRQIKECYDNIGQKVFQKDTQSSFWGNIKKEIGRVVKPEGKVITCGWNSGGCGKTNGFEISEILIVPHGGWHNDTIVTVENKIIRIVGT